MLKNLALQLGGAVAACVACVGRVPKILALRPFIALAIVAASAVAMPIAQAEAPPLDPNARHAKAEAMFRERCKTAGEFIHRTVENVEGVLLMKIRLTDNFGDQFRMDDPYGHDSTGDEYFKSFLYGRRASGSLTNKPEEVATRGYRYVEAIDPADGKRYRYTGRIDEPWRYDKSYSVTYRRFVLDKVTAPSAPPRYGVIYDDISTREEREYWIAGSSLRVIDLKTNEVIAERIGYMMDRGQGARSGGRSPWLLAASNACPSFLPDDQRSRSPGFSYQAGQARNFVEKVLKPRSAN